MVEAAEARQSRHVLRRALDDLAVARQRGVAVLQVVLVDLGGPVQQRSARLGCLDQLHLQLERANELLPAASALGGTLHGVDRTQVIVIDVQDAAIRGHGLTG